MNPFDEPASCTNTKPACFSDDSTHLQSLSRVFDTLYDAGVDTVVAIRLAFLGAAAFILVLYSIPALRTRLFAYGARLSVEQGSHGKNNTQKRLQEKETTVVDTLLDAIASLRVSHSYFALFYVTSTTLSLLWLSLGLISNRIFPLIAVYTHARPSITHSQLLLLWSLLSIQGTRRLLESLPSLLTPSTSKMWIGHFIMGMAFYILISIAVWMEGIPALLQLPWLAEPDDYIQRIASAYLSPLFIFETSPADLIARLPLPSIRTVIFLPLFIFASGMQHDVHMYLSSLSKVPSPTSSSPSSSTAKTYTLPSHPSFRTTVTPHYFYEILIYVSLSFLGAPEGSMVNWTLVCATVFVAVNLGVTAIGTREMWIRRWGAESVRGRARMVPGLW